MTNAKTPTLGRREALARLGLSIVVAYSAPTVLQLDRQAGAVQPSCTGKGKGKGNPWCKGKGARDKAWEDWRDRHGSRYAYGSYGVDARDRRDAFRRAGVGGGSHSPSDRRRDRNDRDNRGPESSHGSSRGSDRGSGKRR